MRILLLPATVLALCVPAAAAEDALSDDMTCEEAVAHYAEYGRINTTMDGQVLPIYGGVPVSERAGMICDEDDAPTETFVKTKDKEQCPIAFSCIGD
ncbi:MAG: hypothetical protein AAGC96_11720 [Pseudomonadota bacterium]